MALTSGDTPHRVAHRIQPVMMIVGVIVLAVGVADCLSAVSTESASLTYAEPSAVKVSSVPKQIAVWRNGGDMDRLDVIVNDLHRGGIAGVSGDLAALDEASNSLQDVVKVAQAYVPPSDLQAQAHWALARALLARNSRQCISGVSGGKPSMLDRETVGSQARGGLTLASARIVAPSSGVLVVVDIQMATTSHPDSVADDFSVTGPDVGRTVTTSLRTDGADGCGWPRRRMKTTRGRVRS